MHGGAYVLPVPWRGPAAGRPPSTGPERCRAPAAATAVSAAAAAVSAAAAAVAAAAAARPAPAGAAAPTARVSALRRQPLRGRPVWWRRRRLEGEGSSAAMAVGGRETAARAAVQTAPALPPRGPSGPPPRPPVVVVVWGPTGVGKTSVGSTLARRLDVPFYDADDYHPPANVAKMASGVGLDDADRQPWLATLAALLASLRAAAVAPAPASAPADGAAGGGGALPPPPPPAAVASLPTVPLVVGVLACSALKVAYRRALEGAPPAGGAPAVGTVVWVGLAAPAATLAARVTARRSASGHWMGASMVAGQLIDWERWTPGEGAGWEVTPGGGGGGGEGGVDAVVSSVMDTWQRWVEGVVEKGE